VKVTLIGAGSTVFARTLIGDIVSFPDLADRLTIALMDIDEERLLVSQRIASALSPKVPLEATLDRRAALDG
jgi:alpha-galactosidase